MSTRKTVSRDRVEIKKSPLTVKKALSTWQTLATLIGSTIVIGSAALWILSTQFARSVDLQKVEDAQTHMQFRLETKDLELSGAMGLMKVEDANIQTSVGSVKTDVHEVKTEIKEIRKEQQQTNENLIRLMERFSVKPVELK